MLIMADGMADGMGIYWHGSRVEAWGGFMASEGWC